MLTGSGGCNWSWSIIQGAGTGNFRINTCNMSVFGVFVLSRYLENSPRIKQQPHRQLDFLGFHAVQECPRQLELLRNVGCGQVELLHKNSCFAAFGAVKTTASPGR
jgi:hypothetical protein